MLWLYRLQQRLSITRRESWAILSLLGLFLLGVTVQEVRRHQTPPLAADAFLEPRAPVADSSTGDFRPRALGGGEHGVRASTASLPHDEAIVNVNRASPAALQSLPGIGPALAERIVRYRDRRPFQEPAELERVSGIGPKTVQRLLPRITVTDAESDAASDTTSLPSH